MSLPPRAFRLVAGFPNPVSWAADQVQDFVGGVAENGFELVIAGMTAWVLDGVVWIVEGVFDFFLDSTDPNVQADWFVAGNGPYAVTATIGATLLVGFVLAGVAQGVLSGDTAGMLRRFALDLPVSVLGMVGLVTVTQVLIRVTDSLSTGVLDAFADDVAAFTRAVASISSLSGGVATALVVFLLALVAVIAGIVLVAELVIRAALIYLVVALAPLVFAARLWPALKGASRKLLDLLAALVLSKLVIAVALAVAAAAAAGAGTGGEVTALPPPEAAAEDPGGSVTQAVGVLLAAVAAFGISAFSPLLVARLLPVTEAAMVAQGVRGGPVRAGQQAVTVGYYTRYARGSLRQSREGAAGGSKQGAAAAGAGGSGSAGAAGGAAAGAAAAGAAAKAASTGSRAATETATATTDRPRPESAGGKGEPSPGTTGRRSTPPRRPRTGDGDGRGPRRGREEGS